jgi:Protein of unknown function (DUF1769)
VPASMKNHERGGRVGESLHVQEKEEPSSQTHSLRPNSARALLGRFSFRKSSPSAKAKDEDSKETAGSSLGGNDEPEEPVTAILLEQTSLGLSATEDSADTSALLSAEGPRCHSAVSIFEHSYRLCGCSVAEVNHHLRSTLSPRFHLPDDPTVKESIECVFASQLSQGLDLLLDDADDEDLGGGFFARTASDGGIITVDQQLPPSRLHQTRSQTRPKVPSPRRKRRTAARMTHVGTYDHGREISDCHLPLPIARQKLAEPLPVQCLCATRSTPAPPQNWPQKPLLLRPSRGTVVLGVRLCHSEEYLWKPGSPGTWLSALGNQNGGTTPSDPVTCERCCPLPINNGNEPEALVTDFITPFFQGTLLVRIRDSGGATPDAVGKDGYFSGMNRTYQAVVKGRFLKPINLVACQTGFQLERPCGKLPARWIVSSALRVMSFFAPQLQAVIDSSSPSYALTPLGSTPQCVIKCDDHDETPIDIEKILHEPSSARHSLLGKTTGATSIQRARFRKKHWDRSFQEKRHIAADMSSTYVFEFLQHLFDFHHLQLDLGSLGSVGLQGILNGQPLNILALHESTPLWSFDLWHEQLYEDAVTLDQGR